MKAKFVTLHNRAFSHKYESLHGFWFGFNFSFFSGVDEVEELFFKLEKNS